MNEQHHRFEEMLQAAETAGDPSVGPEEARELEAMWLQLEVTIASDRENIPPLFPLQKLPARDDGPAASRPGGRGSRLFFWTAGLAAIVTFGVMLFQVLIIRAAYEELQQDMRELQTSVILSALKSDSAAERLDGLLKVANGQIHSEILIQAVLHRLSTDPSTNIRLASVRALGPFANHPDVVSSLSEMVRQEPSPLVQLDILNLVRKVRPEVAEQLLQDLSADGGMVQYLHPASGTLDKATRL